MIKLSDVREGSKVQIRPWVGSSNPIVTVEEVEEDVKNGEPGILHDHDGGGWCYLSQIVRVIQY
jgi:hypothetical protein